MTVRAVLIVGVTVWVNSNVAGSVLRAHVPSPDQAGQVPVDAIHQSARRVMEHSDFRSVRRRVLEQVPVQDLDRGFLKGLMNSIGNGLSDFLSWLVPPSRPVRPAVNPQPRRSSPPSRVAWDGIDVVRVATVMMVVAVSGVLIWLVARVIRLHQQDPDRGAIPTINDSGLELSAPPGEVSASTYESRVLQFAHQGKFSAGIRELLLGSMSWIERAGLIRFRKGLTNRDYLRAVWTEKDRRSAYLVTGTEFELVFFGRRTATSEMFERCLAAFQGAFHEDAETARHQS
jgi:hypothetical protein